MIAMTTSNSIKVKPRRLREIMIGPPGAIVRGREVTDFRVHSRLKSAEKMMFR